ncbi:MAG: alpha/beta fold hydrolase [Hyphomicrobiales bacterium]
MKEKIEIQRSQPEFAENPFALVDAMGHFSGDIAQRISQISTSELEAVFHALEQHEKARRALGDSKIGSRDSDFGYFIVEDRRRVLAANVCAQRLLGVFHNSSANHIDFRSFPSHTDLTQSVNTLQLGNLFLKKGAEGADAVRIHLQSALKGNSLELFVLCDAAKKQNLAILAERFGLSPTEQTIVEMSFSGLTMDEIAERRSRSLQTIKTQFYRALAKCDCKNQAELFRKISVIMSLKEIFIPQENASAQSCRREHLLIRPQGRTLDVVIAGKDDGLIFVSCNTHLKRCFPPWLERLLNDHGITIISIAPPGSGKTSPPPHGTPIDECFAKDISAVLDSIGAPQAVLLGTTIGFSLCLRTANLIPDRIRAVFSNAVIAPPARVAAHSTKSRWLLNFRKIFIGTFDVVDDAICRGYFNYMSYVGLESYIQASCSHDPRGRAAALEPENFGPIEDAFDASMVQSMDLNIALLKDALTENWETLLEEGCVPIHMCIGSEDSVGPYEALKEIATDHPAKISFETVDGGTSVFHYYEPMRLIAALKTAAGAIVRESDSARTD